MVAAGGKGIPGGAAYQSFVPLAREAQVVPLAREAQEFVFVNVPCWDRPPALCCGPEHGCVRDIVGGGLAAGKLLVGLAPAALLLVLLAACQPEDQVDHRITAAPRGDRGSGGIRSSGGAFFSRGSSVSAGLLKAFGEQDACEVSFADQDPSAECFCQVARNPGCSGRPCSCTAACPPDEASVWRLPSAVSFVGERSAEGCSGKGTSIVTVSKSYFANLDDLKNTCSDRMTDLIAEMVTGGLRAYRQAVGLGAVRHCIKGLGLPGAPWLHVVTFCAEGEIDHMPSSASLNWCTTMTDEGQAQWAATLATVWAGGPYSLPAPLPDAGAGAFAVGGAGSPDSCREVGCGNHRPKPECSCNGACRQHGDCCSDYGALCEAGGNSSGGAQCYYKYHSGGIHELCFCQLAGNPGCVNQSCACDQGCTGDALLGSSGQSVTFNNIHEARGCVGPPCCVADDPQVVLQQHPISQA